MSRFIYGYHGDGCLCVKIYTDSLDGQRIWAPEFFKGLVRWGRPKQAVCVQTLNLAFWLRRAVNGHWFVRELVCSADNGVHLHNCFHLRCASVGSKGLSLHSLLSHFSY